MNESVPSNASVESPAPAYKDRSTGLMIFGILTILLGCLAGLCVLLMFAGQAFAAGSTTGAANVSTLLPAISVYVMLAVALIWLGIGSIQARRWARALLLIFSWGWLVMGVLTLIVMALIVPKMLRNLPSTGAADHPAMPPSAMGIAILVMLLVLSVFFVLLPAVWTYFYSSSHVKATCEARDGVTRWTDGCPLPVLALSLWLAFAVPLMLLMPLTGHCVMPFFGAFLTGAPGNLFCLALAALWGYVAWLIYHLKPQGWWLILIAMTVFMVSSWMTFARHDMVEMYRLMDYPQAQIDQIQKTGLLGSMRWLPALSLLPFLGYLLFVKKYFRAHGR